jgi:hypothetical protein
VKLGGYASAGLVAKSRASVGCQPAASTRRSTLKVTQLTNGWTEVPVEAARVTSEQEYSPLSRVCVLKFTSLVYAYMAGKCDCGNQRHAFKTESTRD